MKVRYDSVVDAAYIELEENPGEVTTVRINENVAMDLGRDERLVGLEILNARQLLFGGKDLEVKVIETASAA